MSEDLYEDGFHNITSIDYSPVVVKAMQDKYKEKLGMQCTSEPSQPCSHPF